MPPSIGDLITQAAPTDALSNTAKGIESGLDMALKYAQQKDLHEQRVQELEMKKQELQQKQLDYGIGLIKTGSASETKSQREFFLNNAVNHFNRSGLFQVTDSTKELIKQVAADDAVMSAMNIRLSSATNLKDANEAMSDLSQMISDPIKFAEIRQKLLQPFTKTAGGAADRLILNNGLQLAKSPALSGHPEIASRLSPDNFVKNRADFEAALNEADMLHGGNLKHVQETNIGLKQGALNERQVRGAEAASGKKINEKRMGELAPLVTEVAKLNDTLKAGGEINWPVFHEAQQGLAGLLSTKASAVVSDMKLKGISPKIAEEQVNAVETWLSSEYKGAPPPRLVKQVLDSVNRIGSTIIGEYDHNVNQYARAEVKSGRWTELEARDYFESAKKDPASKYVPSNLPLKPMGGIGAASKGFKQENSGNVIIPGQKKPISAQTPVAPSSDKKQLLIDRMKQDGASVEDIIDELEARGLDSSGVE